jgi:hypothetical protein
MPEDTRVIELLSAIKAELDTVVRRQGFGSSQISVDKVSNQVQAMTPSTDFDIKIIEIMTKQTTILEEFSKKLDRNRVDECTEHRDMNSLLLRIFMAVAAISIAIGVSTEYLIR